MDPDTSCLFMPTILMLELEERQLLELEDDVASQYILTEKGRKTFSWVAENVEGF